MAKGLSVVSKAVSLLSLIATLFFVVPSFAQTKEKTPAITHESADKLASSFVYAVNKGDRDTLKTFFSTNVDPAVAQRISADVFVITLSAYIDETDFCSVIKLTL